MISIYTIIISSIKRIAALHGMLWVTPRYLVHGFFAGKSIAFRSVDRGGFQDIFDAMIEDQDIDIVFNYNVQVNPLFTYIPVDFFCDLVSTRISNSFELSFSRKGPVRQPSAQFFSASANPATPSRSQPATPSATASAPSASSCGAASSAILSSARPG